MSKAFERANVITGDIIDAELPHNWIIEHMMVHKDLSVACGFEITLPPFFTMAEEQQDLLHQRLCGFLNTLDERYHMQFVWEVHRESDDLVEKIRALEPRNKLMQEYQDETVERLIKSAKERRLRRYRAYVLLVHPPLYNASKFKQRYGKEKKERKRLGLWTEEYSTSNFLMDLFGLAEPPPFAMQYTDSEWDQLRTNVNNTSTALESTLESMGLKPKYLYEQDLVDLMYQWWNPRTTESGVKAPEVTPEPRMVTDYCIESAVSTDRKRGYLYMDNAVHRLLTLRTPPSDLSVNTFQAMLDENAVPNLRIVCNLVPYSTDKRINELQDRLPLLENRVAKERRLAVTVDQINQEILRLQSGDETSWSMTMLFHTWAENEDDVDLYAGEVKRIARMSGNAVVTQEEHALWRYWLSAQPLWTRDVDIHRRHIFSASQVCCLLPLSGHPEQFDEQPPSVMLETANSSILNFSPMDTRLNNFNCIVMGASGTGKSFLAGSIMMGMQSQNPRIIGIDLGGSYTALCDALNGEYITMDPNSKRQTINPLYVNRVNRADDEEVISPSDRNQILRFLEKALLEPNQEFDKNTKAQMDEILYKLYLNSGGKEVFMNDLRSAMQAYGGTGNERIQDLSVRMNSWCKSGQYGSLFDGRTMLDFDKSFLIFDMSSVKDNKEIAPLTIMSIMNHVRQMALNYPDDPKILLMDEAWFLLDDTASAKFVEECFRTFRKLNVSIIGVSQGISEWMVNDNASAILLNVSTYLILNQTNPKAIHDAKDLLDLSDAECQIVGNLKKVKGDFAQALMFQKFQDSNFSTVLLNRTTPLQYAIMTTNPQDKQAIEQIKRELGCTMLDARLEFSRRHPRGV